MTQLAVVVNPHAGGGRGARVWERLRADPRLAGATVVDPVDAEAVPDRLAAALERGARRVVVVGGDGTLHLVANAVLDLERARDVTLALLPAGTGSDLARTLGLRPLGHDAVERAVAGCPRALDVLRLETDDGRRRFVINVASAGISGVVDEAVNAMPRRGRAAYLRATLAAVWRFRSVPCRLDVDGERWHDGNVLLVAVANGATFGRGMRIAPGARPDDGLADVVLVRPVPRWQLPARLPQIYRGTHVRTRFVRTGHARQVRLEPAADFPPFDLDGEVFAAAPCTITLLAGALRVAC